MTREEKAHSLGQMYFPDDQCIWARPNYEAKFVSDACMQMAEFEHKRLVEKACDWLRATSNFYQGGSKGDPRKSKAIQRSIGELIPRHEKGFEEHEQNPQRMWQRGVAQRRRLRFLDMKQYLSSAQTAKLIELRFEKPKSIIDVWAHETDIDMEYEYEYAYSIGELIEMLPPSAKIKGYDCFLYIEPQHYDGGWDVGYMRYNVELNHRSTELVDALYAVILQLKEKGVI